MNRRQALTRVGVILGGTVTGAALFLEGCAPGGKKHTAWDVFNDHDVHYLDEIAETIIPATHTPGAKAAQVGIFMTVMVKDCYEEADQKIFREGMEMINHLAKMKFDQVFLQLSAADRHILLTEIDKEQSDYTLNKKENDPAHYFRLMKELTLLGFFTSEPGATKALRYVESPGKYDGNLPYKKGDKAWALN